MSLSPDLLARIRAASDEHGGPRAAMLEALKLIQHEHGWVSDGHLAEAASALGVHRAEMEALASFYSLIFRHPVGKTVILLCDGASCWLNGAEEVREELKRRLGIGFGETTRDGRYTLLNVACLGGCDRAPAAVVGRDRRLVGPLSPAGVAALLEDGL
ncbi:NADH-quinone oxidoreductase subunit NuoE [Cereibacter azotoformans]|uniref:NADH-quinone oxidoreductase subunit NuoE n=1 Tax=Cereibacter azotoformans TaxID=43057 RepID=UPI003B20F05B